ncbi:SH3 domain-containing protein [Phototrophicus methaneseepsis]|uniref:SH3 domain-containing protein n=1 Tax=Phototrophicus methaneseepsis TaxID=2710758 RepID=A0A7S8E7F0_9CHLR|nr:CARDB domain-containing protein [Phototrophicus methaneseepsis]QPC81757.1 SH3 domain-containing protein [Phototrophicus methaneseepsis]
MRGWIYIALLALFTAVACNLGGQSATPTPEPIDIETAEPTGKPHVSIVSPSNGAEFTVDEPVLVSVNATDSTGVTRVQLFAEGQVVKTVSSENVAGEQTLTAVLDYTPRATGEVTLQVLAFRGSVASDPEEIQIVVLEEENTASGGNASGGNTGGSTGGNTGGGSTGGNTGVPVIPNDGVCRALTNVGLNFRSQPTTASNNIITTLPVGTLAPIIARLPDNSWWKLQYGVNVGWVSSQFTTEYGICTNVPIEIFNPTATPTRTSTPTPTYTPTPLITNTPVVRPPDLVVPSIVAQSAPIIPAGQTQVTITIGVTVTNIGFGPSGSFEVQMKVEDEIYDLGSVSGLEQAQSIVLTQDVVFEGTGDYDIRVDVDLDDDVDEISEVNNRGDITVTVTAE